MAVVPRHLTGQTRTEAVCYRSADRTLGDDFIIGAILDISISGRRIRRLDRNEMHQSRGGVLSEHRTMWTTQDLNALDIEQCPVNCRFVAHEDIVRIDRYRHLIEPRREGGTPDARTRDVHDSVGY